MNYNKFFEMDKSEIYAQDARKLMESLENDPNFREASTRLMRACEKRIKDFMIEKRYSEKDDVVNFMQALQDASANDLSQKPEIGNVIVSLVNLIAFKLKTVEQKA